MSLSYDLLGHHLSQQKVLGVLRDSRQIQIQIRLKLKRLKRGTKPGIPILEEKLKPENKMVCILSYYQVAAAPS